MTNEQILEQQVEALEKLLKLKQAVVEELEAKINRLQFPYPGLGGIINTPFIQPYPGHLGGGGGGWQGQGQAGSVTICNHEYPSMWGGTGPVPCTKCGQPFQGASGNITIVGSNGNNGTLAGVNAGHGIAHTSGFIAPLDNVTAIKLYICIMAL